MGEGAFLGVLTGGVEGDAHPLAGPGEYPWSAVSNCKARLPTLNLLNDLSCHRKKVGEGRTPQSQQRSIIGAALRPPV